MNDSPAILILRYFVVPLWFVAGWADWWCHQRARIAATAGAKESLLHLAMFATVGIGLVAALYLEITLTILLLLVLVFIVHHVIAYWDVDYAVSVRRVSPFEQQVHSLLEVIPLMAILLIASVHWDQLTALVDKGPAAWDWSVRLKRLPLPWSYTLSVLGVAVVGELVPYLIELGAGRRMDKRKRSLSSAPVPMRP